MKLSKRKRAGRVPQVIRFLLGEAALDGCWFGDDYGPHGQPRFWWRKKLRWHWAHKSKRTTGAKK